MENEERKTPDEEFQNFISELPGNLTRNLAKIEPVFPTDAVPESVLQGLKEGKSLDLARQWDATIAEMNEKLTGGQIAEAQKLRERPSWTPIPADVSGNIKV